MKLPHFWIIAEEAETKTATELAEQFGCHRSSIYKTAAAQKFAFVSGYVRKLPPAAELKALVKRKPKTTSSDLQKAYGVCAATVSLACKAAGVKLRRAPYSRRKTQEARS